MLLAVLLGGTSSRTWNRDREPKVALRAQIVATIVALSSGLGIQARAEDAPIDAQKFASCLEQLKTQAINRQINITVTSEAERAWENRFNKGYSLTPAARSERTFEWTKHADESLPVQLEVVDQTTSGLRFQSMSVSIKPNRTESSFYALEIIREGSIVSGTKQDYMRTQQTLDIDQNCQAHTILTYFQVVRADGKTITNHSQAFGPSGLGNAPHSDSKPQPLFGDLKLFQPQTNTKKQIEAVVRRMKTLPLLMVQSGVASTDSISRPQAKTMSYLNPLTERQETLRGYSFLIQIGALNLISSLYSSADDRFHLSIEDNNIYWRLPLEFWIKAQLPRLSHISEFPLDSELALTGDVEATSVAVRADGDMGFENLKAYWNARPDALENSPKRSLILASQPPIILSQFPNQPLYAFPPAEPYLQNSGYVQKDSDKIRALVKEVRTLAGRGAGASRLAEAITTVMSRHLKYQFGRLEVGGQITEFSTSEIIAQGGGTCQNFAVVFAAIARALGIPTRIISGIHLEGDTGTWHAWNEIEMAPGKWIPLDPQEHPMVMHLNSYFPVVVDPNDSYRDPLVQAQEPNFHFTILATQPIVY
jgi:hypothetical protein